MSTIDYSVELAESDALLAKRRGAIRFLLRHYPLGAIGAVIIGLFVSVAVFASFITAYDRRQAVIGAAERIALARS